MKKILLTTVFIAVTLSMIMAQIPHAFKYQAVVRNNDGEILSDQNINLRISILYDNPSGNQVYSETHPVTTNGMGLVNLEIGRGNDPTGNLSKINWAAGNYFIQIEMDEFGGADFKHMGVTQLLSVPFALHSGTALEIANSSSGDTLMRGVPAQSWSLFGNSKSSPPEDKLGTTDDADLMMVTNDIERLRIKSDGDVEIARSLNIGENLTVEENVFLNTEAGSTTNYGDFTVANNSPTLLSGTLVVDEATDLNSSLNVDGVTNLNSAFYVNNDSPSVMTGTLNVNKDATFNQHVTLDNDSLGSTSPSNGALVVNGGVGIGQNLNVAGDAVFDGDVTIKGPLALTDTTQSYDDTTGALTVTGGVGIGKRLNVGGATKIENTLGVDGQVTITANPGTSQSNYNNYPLQVKGGQQGIAIKVNGGRSIDNNYISFWDEETGLMWGRIEGMTIGELHDNELYKREQAFKTTDITIASVDFAIAGFEVAQAVVDLAASASSTTACVGFGACITAPIPSFIIAAGTSLVLKIANAVSAGANLGATIADKVTYTNYEEANIGVSFSSGAGDYAEWLPKKSTSETFNPGDIVGVTNGYVTKSTSGADKIMVISTRPIVLGNMPSGDDEVNYEKIAFMGQVPVKVLGDVIPGDYILPNVIGSGFGRAVHPENMKINDYKKIAGVVWSINGNIGDGLNLVNVAVGINTNDLTNVVYKQEEQLLALQAEQNQLRTQIEQSNSALKSLLPGYAEALGLDYSVDTLKDIQVGENDAHTEYDIVQSHEEDILYFEVSREQIKSSILMARETYAQMIVDANQANKLFSDVNNKSNSSSENVALPPISEHPFWQRIDSDPAYMEEIIQFVQSSMENTVHTHKKYASKFTDVKLHE